MEDRIPTLSDQELRNLRDNAARLSSYGSGRQQMEAERLLPLIATELGARSASAPPARAKQAAAPKKTKAAAPAKRAAKPAKRASKVSDPA